MEKYNLGLTLNKTKDGFAVVSNDFSLLRVKGKDYWGVREFDEASLKEERRKIKTGRRLLDRKQARIALLRMYFGEAIDREDPLFFIRLNNSKYHVGDKDEVLLGQKNGVFSDANYTDSDYFENYPTVFHLRKALIEEAVPVDGKYARLVFLALSSMFGSRGNFLADGLNDTDKGNAFDQAFQHLIQLIEEQLGFSFDHACSEKVEGILASRSMSKTDKSKELMKLFNFGTRNKKESVVIRALCGFKVDCKKLFTEVATEEKIDICFEDEDFFEKQDSLLDILGDENVLILSIMKEVHDIGKLSGILHGFPYISFAKVNLYEKHKSDLKLLKDVYRKYFPTSEYDHMFREAVPGSYSSYVNSCCSHNTESKACRRFRGKNDREMFFGNLSKKLSRIQDESAERILTEIENDTFLPKQRTTENMYIPYQVHLTELKKILSNAEKHLPLLLAKDESGLTVSERIIQLFRFRIPYYIGPLSPRSTTGWIVRKEGGKIYPWNIEEKIDVKETREQFIKTLIRDCRYICEEKVLPKKSIMYEEMILLDELNKIYIKQKKISHYVKQDLFNNFFCTEKKPTEKRLISYLIDKGVIIDKNDVMGTSSLLYTCFSTYSKFYPIFEEQTGTKACRKMIDRIVELSTIYGESKRDLSQMLRLEFGDVLSEDKIKRILGYKFKDWGEFSSEFANLKGCLRDTGEVMTLRDVLWETEMTMEEVINSELYTFGEEIASKQYKKISPLFDFRPSDLDSTFFPAPLKRMVNQAVRITKEVTKEMGSEPSKLYLNTSYRSLLEEDAFGHPDQRASQLLAFYKNIKDKNRNWSDEIKKANEEGKFRERKYFLYYLQMGRCMYSGEEIKLEDLETEKYNIDHIVPKHIIKDESLSRNCVLVKEELNRRKAGEYPIMPLQKEAYELWEQLHDIKNPGGQRMLGDEKYLRLFRTDKISYRERAKMVADYLDTKNYVASHICNIFAQLLPRTEIVYVRKELIDDFRNGLNGSKSEENEIEGKPYRRSSSVNNYDEAKDAYLNVVTGRVYGAKFTRNPYGYLRHKFKNEDGTYNYHLYHIFDYDVKDEKGIVWEAGVNGTIRKVDSIMRKNTVLATYMLKEGRGSLFKTTCYPARVAKTDGYLPIKTSDPKMQDVTKYGGVTSITGSYFFLVEHEVKSQRIRTFETVPVYLQNKLDTDDKLVQYCINKLNLKDPKILYRRILPQSLLEINGYRVRITGRSMNRIMAQNATQLCLSPEWVNHIHYIERVRDKGPLPKYISSNIEESRKLNEELYDILSEKHSSGIFSRRLNPVGKKVLSGGKEMFHAMDIKEQCIVLSQILGLSTSGPTNADLKRLGGSEHSGIMSFDKNISKLSSICLIQQSVTGINEFKKDLLQK